MEPKFKKKNHQYLEAFHVYIDDMILSKKSIFNSAIILFLNLLAVVLLNFFYDFSDGYDSIRYLGILYIVNFLCILYLHGVFSTLFILTFLLFSVLFVPFLSLSIFGTPLYSFHNIFHQLDTENIIFVSMLSCGAFILHNILINFFSRKIFHQYQDTSFAEIKIPIQLIILLYLFFSFLAEPGQTILTADYSTLMEERSGFSNLAGNMMMTFWVIFHMQMRNIQSVSYQSFWYRVYLGVTALGVIWLFLHARRSELIGFIIMILLNDKFIFKKISKIKIGVAGVFLVLMFLLGYVRNYGMKGLDNLQSSYEITSTDLPISNMPSGLGNIMMTFSTSVYYINHDKNPYLEGKTVKNYPKKLLPSNFLSPFGLSKPTYINEIVFKNYSYNGGYYVLAPLFVNYGIFGFILSVVIMAIVVSTCFNWINSPNLFKSFTSIITILYFIKTVWYGPVPWLKGLYMGIIVLGIYKIMEVSILKGRGKV